MEFFTWEQVLTGGGLALLVTFIVQYVKGFTIPMNPNALRLGVYVISVIILNTAAFFTGAWSVGYIGLSLINGVLVSLAAMGEYEIIKSTGLFKSTSDLLAMKNK